MPTVNHNNLVWARQKARLSLEDAAHKLQLKDSGRSSAVEKLEAFESGDNNPSRPMLTRMASTYRKPLLSFYLSEEPTTPERGEDFRTLTSAADQSDSFYLDTLIRDIRTSQRLLRETLEDEDEAAELSFVGIHTIDSGIDAVVETIKTAINFSLEEFRKSDSSENAFKYLRRSAESAGVYVVLRGNLGSSHTNIPVKVFRGFALSDEVAPFIVINDRDAKSAWSFTLFHELAHIVLGKTGISGGTAELAIEKFCNNVASEITLPTSDFAQFTVRTKDPEELKQIVSEYADSINVSSSQVAYRLHKRGGISKAVWEELRDYFRTSWLDHRDRLKAINKIKRETNPNGGGPSFYVLRRHSLGSALVDAVQRFTQSGALSTTKAGTLLGVRPLKVHKLFKDNMYSGGGST